MTFLCSPLVIAEKSFRGELSLSNEERDILLYLLFNHEEDRQTLQVMAKSLRMSKNTVLKAIVGLEERAYLGRELSSLAGKRKRAIYTVLSHPDFLIESTSTSVLQSTAPVVLPRTDPPEVASAAQDRSGVATASSYQRAEFIEAARQIEGLFKGKGGYVPFRQLNDAVEEFLIERGHREYEAFCAWLWAGRWRALAVSDLPALLERWDREKQSKGFEPLKNAETCQ